MNNTEPTHHCTVSPVVRADEEGYLYESRQCIECGKEERNYDLQLKD